MATGGLKARRKIGRLDSKVQADLDEDAMLKKMMSKRSSTTGQVMDVHRPLLCEMEYPLMHDRPYLYVAFPQNECSGMNLDVMSEGEHKTTLVEMFGVEFLTGVEKIKYNVDVGASFGALHLVYCDVTAAHAAKSCARVHCGETGWSRDKHARVSQRFSNSYSRLSFSKPNADHMRERLAVLWIGACEFVDEKLDAFQVTEDDMMDFLTKGGPQPVAVTKFVLDKADVSNVPCPKCLHSLPPETGLELGHECRVCSFWVWQQEKVQKVKSKLSEILPAAPPRGRRLTDEEKGSLKAFKNLRRCGSALQTSLNKEVIWKVTYSNEESLREAKGMVKEKLAKTYTDYVPVPMSQGLVICFRTSDLPHELFQKLLLTVPDNEFQAVLDPFGKSANQLGRKSRTGAIVEDFEYAKEDAMLTENDLEDKFEGPLKEAIVLPHKQAKGDVYYSTDVWESATHNYARVITENWWYFTVAGALIASVLALMDLYSNAVYVSNLFTPLPGERVDYTSNNGLRYNFVASFVVLEYLHFLRCRDFAAEDLKAELKTGSGNIVRPKTRRDWFKLRFSAFVFYFVSIQKLVKDIVVALHPYTGQQQKGAAKLDGTRIFLIGYPSEQMYRVTSALGFNKQIPPVIFSRASLTLFKVYYAYSKQSWMSLTLCATGLVLLPIQILKFRSLMNDRKDVFEDIKEKVETVLENSSYKDSRDGAKGAAVTLSEMQAARDTIPKLKSNVNSWSKHFPEQKDLGMYKWIPDAFTKSLGKMIVVFFALNMGICGLEVYGVLHRGSPGAVVTMASWPAQQEPQVTLSSILAADLDGDGLLSGADLASLGIEWISAARPLVQPSNEQPPNVAEADAFGPEEARDARIGFPDAGEGRALSSELSNFENYHVLT